MDKILNVKINGQDVSVKAGATVLDAAREAGINVPTLCYAKELNHSPGACRLCVVEIEGFRNLQASCVLPAAEGMVIWTNTNRVRNARKMVVELLLSDHPWDCLNCHRNTNCELQKIAQDLNIRNLRVSGAMSEHPTDTSSRSIVREQNKCVKCGRCVTVCNQVQSVSALGYVERGFDTIPTSVFGKDLANTSCVLCGQCTLVCPVAALHEKDEISKAWDALGDKSKHVIVQVAPAIRASIGEEFGMEPGESATGKTFAALKMLGFDSVCDTSFTADVTIMEEAGELIERISGNGKLPQLTSCSPGWVKFIEHFYPELLEHMSSCKSPQMMFGALAKSYYAEKKGINPADIFVVSIMPCTAKKYEAAREEMVNENGLRDVDVVLTTREFARMIKEAGIDFLALQDAEPEQLIGYGTGAGVIFANTGGVMEAALRTAYETITSKNLEHIEFEAVRGFEGIKSAEVDLDGQKVKVAVASGLANARVLLEDIKAGRSEYHFIEIMACPGGCIGGGGQPHSTDKSRKAARAKAIYAEDTNKPIRKSHENPAVQELYKEYLGKPLGEKSHHLLHTHYIPKSKYPVPCE